MGDYDDVTAFLGQKGPYFYRTFFLLNTIFISTGFFGLFIVFVGATPTHHCFIPDSGNLSEAWRKAIIPIKVVNGQEEESKCSRYRLDVVRNLSALGYIPGRDVNLTGVEQECCVDGWSYSKDIYQSTIVTEWDLVCDNEWKTPFASSTLFMGFLIGSLLSGQLSDRFGRKKVLFGSLVAQLISVLIQAFSPSWEVFCIMFTFVGASQISLYISAFVLGTEVLSKSMREVFTTLGAFLHYCIGYMTLPWIAYAMREWRTLLIILSSVTVVYIPLWWFIPESPRWLYSQGRVEEAEAILRDAARRNRVTAPEVIFKDTEQLDVASAPKNKYSMIDVLKTNNIRCVTLMCLFLWMAVNIGYYGLSLNTSNLSGDPYVNCFLSALTEVPAYVVSTALLRNCQRRPLLSAFLLIGGGMLFLIQLIPETVEMVGKFAFTISFTVVYIYTAEIYPTVVRSAGVGICSSAARIGTIAAPYIIYLGSINKYLPYIIMGSMTVASSAVNLFLPETFRKELPETVEQMQQLNNVTMCCT
uniref:Solute carrier family 22 member 5 n=1 Tax=Hucho hucho TaxID=62062 RepID=A0A4W5K492_9TELE